MYKGPPTVLAIFIIVKLGTLVPIAFQLAATGEPVAEAMRRLLLQRDGVDRITIISAWLTNPVLDEFSGILRPLLIENPETELLVIIGSNHHQAISSPLACRRILELQIEFGNRVRFLRYPHENGSTFHAKLYTVRSTIDDETWHGVLIGSANATAKGFGTSTPRNIESYAYEYPIPEEGVENLESQILEIEHQCTEVSIDWIDQYAEMATNFRERIQIAGLNFENATPQSAQTPSTSEATSSNEVEPSEDGFGTENDPEQPTHQTINWDNASYTGILNQLSNLVLGDEEAVENSPLHKLRQVGLNLDGNGNQRDYINGAPALITYLLESEENRSVLSAIIADGNIAMDLAHPVGAAEWREHSWYVEFRNSFSAWMNAMDGNATEIYRLTGGPETLGGLRSRITTSWGGTKNAGNNLIHILALVIALYLVNDEE